jgi:DNA modification methylase
VPAVTVETIVGDCREKLRQLPEKSVHTCITSIPYWGLRDYKIKPSIWGGDPNCAHKFAEKPLLLELRRGTGLATSPHSLRGGALKVETVQYATIERGFCIHCNAWRGCFGLEPTYQLYVEHAVEVFREVWRVLRDDGTLWLNMGDCYANSRAGWSAQRYMDEERDDRTFRDKPFNTFTRGMGSKHERTLKIQQPGGTAVTNNGREVNWGFRSQAMAGAGEKKARVGSNRAQRGDGNDGIAYGPMEQPNRQPQIGLKQKDKAGMPWRVAFALQDDGWYLRQDIIWHKKNPMPESTGDRPTSAHEYLFLFSKSGDTLCWRHADGRWVNEKPEPDWRWRHRKTRVVVAIEPTGRGRRNWFRFNLWRGYDYYYDAYAIMEPSSPDSHARAARHRSKTHKHAGAGPDLSGKPHNIALAAPSAGRIVGPEPSGWDNGEGHHGSLHRDGRRALPAEWKGGGPNSRFNKDRTPRERKVPLSEKDAGRVDQGLRPSTAMGRGAGWRKAAAHSGTYAGHDGPRPKNNANFDAHLATADLVLMRNKRSVWSIATMPFKEAHFATFPPKLIEPCILAGCPKGGTVLDPFFGAGTTGLVAELHGRNCIGIELNPAYAALAEKRIAKGVADHIAALEEQARKLARKAAQALKKFMGPEERERHFIKETGKLKPLTGLPLFTPRSRRLSRVTAHEAGNGAA